MIAQHCSSRNNSCKALQYLYVCMIPRIGQKEGVYNKTSIIERMRLLINVYCVVTSGGEEGGGMATLTLKPPQRDEWFGL